MVTRNGVPDAAPDALASHRGSARIVVIVTLAVVAIAALALLPVKRYTLDLLQWTQGLGAWGPLFLSAFYVVACVFLLPGSVLTLGAGFLFGLKTGFLSAWIGASIGACAAFLVGRTLARDWIANKMRGNSKFEAVDEAVGVEGFKIVFLLRLSPVFPFNLLNYALGLTKIPFPKYGLASALGMIPGGLMYVYLGSAAGSLVQLGHGGSEQTWAQRVLFWVGLAATVAVVVFVTRIARQSLRKAELSAKAERAKPQAAEKAGAKEPVPTCEAGLISPFDAHNKRLQDNVHPCDWINPEPAQRYNLVVIGAGTAGLVTAAGAAGLGAKVALVERHLMGGDCLNVGCVPSKSLISASRAVAAIRKARALGITVDDHRVDFPAVMERVRRIRADISAHDSAQRFRDLGVDVFLGEGAFSGPHTVEVDGKTLRFAKAVIATGGRPVFPQVPGLVEAGFLTNETVFSLTELPQRLAVIGGGPIGCELAQAFQRLGAQVFLFHKGDHILDREDPQAAEIVQRRFLDEGVTLFLSADLEHIETRDREKMIRFRAAKGIDTVTVDEILVAAGRAPNVEGLNLDAAGVEYDPRLGVKVSDRLQTSNPHIFAAGDICMQYKFTHAADAAARIVIQNALFRGRKQLSALTIPWCTYTDPEIAHVGLYEKDAARLGIALDAYQVPLSQVDRAVTDAAQDGFAHILTEKGTDHIVGATIVADHAGDMISEVTVAMVGGVGLGTISAVVHPYPTQAEVIKKAADAYNRTRLTPTVKFLLERWLRWTR
ncbi:MAG: FAD-containing oxidoreductase [Thermodesulfobacteriota bacterium]